MVTTLVLKILLKVENSVIILDASALWYLSFFVWNIRFEITLYTLAGSTLYAVHVNVNLLGLLQLCRASGRKRCAKRNRTTKWKGATDLLHLHKLFQYLRRGSLKNLINCWGGVECHSKQCVIPCYCIVQLDICAIVCN